MEKEGLRPTLHLLIGRSGTGKSAAIIEKMAQNASARRQILIVPEQYSHQAERKLCAHGGNSLNLRAEVLTFTRLAGRVFAQSGGLAAPTLDGGGRVLVMYLAVQEAMQALQLYRKPSAKPAFLKNLLDTMDECKSYRLTPERFAKAGEELGGATGRKLQDLACIFNAYDRLCQTLGSDPRDKLTRLAEGLRKSRFCQDTDVYLDGFTDFTPQQALVLSALMEQARSVTVALTCDHLEEDEEGLGIFSPARKTAAYLRFLAKNAPAEVQVETRTRPLSGKAAPLVHLERELFAQEPRPWSEGKTSHIRMVRCQSPRQEVEWAADQVLKLAREKGWRFRDMAVTARSFEGYEALVDEIFPRYGIPVFLARTQEVLEKPILALVTGALAAISGGYRYEDMFRYLKTGLAGISDEERDKLENYVLTWDIKGGMWSARQNWHMHPMGYGHAFSEGDEAAVAELDATRRRVIAPLENLRKAAGTTGRDRAMALYDFLEEIDLPQTLHERVELLRQRGELELAEEYGQLWKILTGALEQCARLLRERDMDWGEFEKLFSLVLSRYQVGTIPVALDRLTAGACPRLGYQSYKALIFLGCDDKQLPLCAPSAGLLTDEDRAALSGLGMTLAPRMEDKLTREMTIAYTAVCQPTQALYLSYPAGADGDERRESFLIKRLERLFPEEWPKALSTEEDPRLAAPAPAMELAPQRPEVRAALEELEEYAPHLKRMEEALGQERGGLSESGVAALYGRRAPMSASRLDLYRSCHFSYFMRYGLSAQPRRKAGFAAPEYGTFVHAVLEEVLKNWDKSMDEAATAALTRRAMDRYLAEELGGLEDKSPRFAFLFGRLGKTVERVVKNATDELRASEFKPIAFELGFGRGKDLPPVEIREGDLTLSVSGFVDRVDGWEKDGKLYLRVVDYKTGRKPFDLADIYHGIGLQMLLYLFTLKNDGKARFGAESIVPAGVLYLPAREVITLGARDMSEETRQAAVDKALKRQGMLLDDRDVLEAMESPEGQNRFLPLRVNKEGFFTGEALAKLEQLGKLERHVERILHEVGQELAAGTVAADPYWRGADQNACRWCEYRAACQFEEGKGSDARRRGRSMKAKDFWDALDGKNCEEGGEDDGLSLD